MYFSTYNLTNQLERFEVILQDGYRILCTMHHLLFASSYTSYSPMVPTSYLQKLISDCNDTVSIPAKLDLLTIVKPSL